MKLGNIDSDEDEQANSEIVPPMPPETMPLLSLPAEEYQPVNKTSEDESENIVNDNVNN